MLSLHPQLSSLVILACLENFLLKLVDLLSLGLVLVFKIFSLIAILRCHCFGL